MTIVCKNCGTHFRGNFCSNCGQKAAADRLRVGNVVNEFWHNVTHTDRGYLSLLGEMFQKPGKVIREYIDVKRKKYFNPYTFYLVTTALLIYIESKVFRYEDKLYNYRNEFGQYINLHYNFIVLFSMPVSALLLRLIFIKRKYNYAEWITFLVFAYGAINFVQIIFQLLYFPLIKYHAEFKSYTDSACYLVLLYILLRFIQPKKWWQLLQCILATVFIYFFTELIAELVALWIYGVPVDRLIQMFKNVF